jgi:hypothetical protein
MKQQRGPNEICSHGSQQRKTSEFGQNGRKNSEINTIELIPIPKWSPLRLELSSTAKI